MSDPIPADRHRPVLLAEVVAALAPERGGLFIDGTLGMGGHAEALLAAAPEGRFRLLGFDQDQQALALAHERLGDRAEYVWANFAQLRESLRERGITQIDGMLMDIGVSSLQLDEAERGFSFMREGPLDMRMDRTVSITAASIVNTWPEHRLVELFRRFGEERFAPKIALAIVRARRAASFTTTTQLADLISECYPAALRGRKPHPATKVFQAIRIQVNEEAYALEKGMDAALGMLAEGGRLAIITFHSLEDRMVKLAFKAACETGNFRLVAKKPIVAARAEVLANPRSRSAKLRVIERALADAA